MPVRACVGFPGPLVPCALSGAELQSPSPSALLRAFALYREPLALSCEWPAGFLAVAVAVMCSRCIPRACLFCSLGLVLTLAVCGCFLLGGLCLVVSWMRCFPIKPFARFPCRIIASCCIMALPLFAPWS